MDAALAIVVAFIAIAAITAVLYYMGILTLNNKTAALFTMNGTYDFSIRHGKVKSCNGTVKQVLRFKDSDKRVVKLDSELVFGTLVINIKDFSGSVNISVGDGASKEEEFIPAVGKPYFLTYNYKNADGEFWFSIKKSSEDISDSSDNKTNLITDM